MKMVVNYQCGPDSEVSTPAELDQVLDHLRQLSVDSGGYGIMGTAQIPDSDPTKGLLDLGAHGDKGFLHYHSYAANINVDSLGEPIDGMVCYWFQEGNDTEIPASAEIPYDEVRKAAHEYLATGGELPSNVTWQPYQDYDG